MASDSASVLMAAIERTLRSTNGTHSGRRGLRLVTRRAALQFSVTREIREPLHPPTQIPVVATARSKNDKSFPQPIAGFLMDGVSWIIRCTIKNGVSHGSK